MTVLTLIFLILGFVFVTGVCIGSFLNVVILRAFSNESICFPGSKCPKCQKPLKWYHNIPIFSYIFLKGKCAFCKEPISIQYPIVELLTGILFVVVFIKFEISLNTLFILAFLSLFIVLAVSDIKEQVVFDMHTYILTGLGLIYNFFDVGDLYQGMKTLNLWHFSFSISNSFIASVLGLVLGVLVMEILARLGYFVAGTRAFGEGDSFIAAGLGSIFGIQYLLRILVLAIVIQIILTVPVYFKKLFVKKDYKTFISMMIFAIIALLMKFVGVISQNMILFSCFVILLLASAIYLCKRILGGLKDKDGFTYLPFGPAMVIAGFIFFFILF